MNQPPINDNNQMNETFKILNIFFLFIVIWRFDVFPIQLAKILEYLSYDTYLEVEKTTFDKK